MLPPCLDGVIDMHLQKFSDDPKGMVTVRPLFSHTSGCLPYPAEGIYGGIA